MRALIVEDDFVSREILYKVLSEFADCDLVDNGREAIEAFDQALLASKPYDLICLDIMMPEVSGLDALQRIRGIEKERGIDSQKEVKVIMATALSDSKEVIEALYKGGASAYFVKPVEIDALVDTIKKLNLIEA